MIFKINNYNQIIKYMKENTNDFIKTKNNNLFKCIKDLYIQLTVEYIKEDDLYIYFNTLDNNNKLLEIENSINEDNYQTFSNIIDGIICLKKNNFVFFDNNKEVNKNVKFEYNMYYEIIIHIVGEIKILNKKYLYLELSQIKIKNDIPEIDISFDPNDFI